MNLYLIGYEGLDQNKFFQLLQLYSVRSLVDIRELPISRKPGFSKSRLIETCQKYKIEYVHKPSLGCPRDIRHTYKKDGNWLNYSVKFFDYLCSQQNELKDLAEIVTKSKSCLMCFEADYLKCHRSYISLMLEKRFIPGLIVRDLRSSTTNEVGKPLLEGIQDQLSTIDLEIDALCPKEKTYLFS